MISSPFWSGVTCSSARTASQQELDQKVTSYICFKFSGWITRNYEEQQDSCILNSNVFCSSASLNEYSDTAEFRPIWWSYYPVECCRQIEYNIGNVFLFMQKVLLSWIMDVRRVVKYLEEELGHREGLLRLWHHGWQSPAPVELRDIFSFPIQFEDVRRSK